MKTTKVIFIKACGGKKKGSCNVWAGDTVGQTTIKIAA